MRAAFWPRRGLSNSLGRRFDELIRRVPVAGSVGPVHLGYLATADRHRQCDWFSRPLVELIASFRQFREDQGVHHTARRRPGDDRHVWPMHAGPMRVVVPVSKAVMVIMVCDHVVVVGLVLVQPVDFDLHSVELGWHSHDQRTDVAADVEQHRTLAGVRILRHGQTLGVPGEL